MMRKKIEELQFETKVTYLTTRFWDGLCAIPKKTPLLILSIMYWVAIIFIMIRLTAPASNILEKLFQPLACIASLICAIAIFVAVVTVYAIPFGAYRLSNAFLRANLFNAAGEPPMLTKRWRENGKIIIEIFTQGIPISEFQDNIETIENALNQRITKIEEGRNKQYILLHLAPGHAKLPGKIYLPQLEPHLPKILLGESLDGPVAVDLNKQPHLLIAGSTGSGKTTLIKSIIAQLLTRTKDNACLCDVYLIDLKGGLDYPPIWRGQMCSFSSSAQDALSLLSYVVQELEQRKIKFAMAGNQHDQSCSSLEDYNQLCPGNSLRRIAVVIDEIAELTDSTGMSKEQKDFAKSIVAQLSTLARLGRAFGINLFLGTQRPDATAIPGQIKNNLDVRICGKADQTLSMIILDNTSASDLIPKDSQGLFINQDGVLFRGYLLNQ